MLATLFDLRIIAIVALIVLLALALAGPLQGHMWSNPDTANELGHINMPNDDCGHNQTLWFWTPQSGWCLRGNISEEKFDKLVEDRHPGVWDTSIDFMDWIDDAVRETLDYLAHLWGALK
jgi:hypothetical protein